MFRNPRRTRAGVSGAAGRDAARQPEIGSEVAAEPELGVAGDTSQVHRSAAARSRSLGRVEPEPA